MTEKEFYSKLSSLEVNHPRHTEDLKLIRDLVVEAGLEFDEEKVDTEELKQIRATVKTLSVCVKCLLEKIDKLIVSAEG